MSSIDVDERRRPAPQPRPPLRNVHDGLRAFRGCVNAMLVSLAVVIAGIVLIELV